MTPTTLGRHCAACRKVVVDFTQYTDAEVLAYFRRAAGGEVCGRLRAEQLNRPLCPVPAKTARGGRWRAWLALVAAAWGVSRGEVLAQPAPHPTHHRPARATPRRRPSTLATKYVQGTVRDSATGAPLAGVAVFLRGENRRATTDSAGRFRLRTTPQRPRGGRALVLHFTGYQSATVRVPATTKPSTTLRLTLAALRGPTEVAVVGYAPPQRTEVLGGAIATYIVEPQPRRLRSFWFRLTRAFRHSS